MVFYLVHPDLLMNCSNQGRELFQIQKDLSCNHDGSFQYRCWACLCSVSMWCAPKLHGGKETGDSHTLSTSDVYCARPFTNLVSFALQQLNNSWIPIPSKASPPSSRPTSPTSSWQMCVHTQAMPLPQGGNYRHLQHQVPLLHSILHSRSYEEFLFLLGIIFQVPGRVWYVKKELN